MLGRRILPKICMLSFAILFSSQVMAQGDRGLSGGPSGRPFTKGPGNALEDGFFDYDAQLWAPVDYTSLNGRVENPTGFYSLFTMSYLSVSRPGAIPGVASTLFQGGNSFHWGKNYQLGFMGENGRGFGLHWQHLTGVSVTAGAAASSVTPQVLDLAYDTVELNRVFREDYGDGCYVEPFFGLRYTHIGDETIENTPTAIIAPNINHQLRQRVGNSALGGQFGARFVQKRGRFTYECDVALAASYNRQTYKTYAQLITPTGTTQREVANENTNFMPTLDLSGALQYQLTRDVSIRFGAEAQFMWEGVARADTRPGVQNPHGLLNIGNPLGVHSEKFIAAGINFGIDWKR